MKPRVHVSGRVPAAIEEALRVDFNLVGSPEGAEGVLSLLTTVVDHDYLERAGSKLRVVANYAVGVNNIDLAEARARDIVVANTPDVLTLATAELTVGLMLSLLRRIAEGDRLIRAGGAWEFDLEFMLGESLEHKVVCVVGAGRIGSEVARLVVAFGALPMATRRTDPLHDVLSQADIVSLHCPLTNETRHLIDEAALTVMKPTAVLVNTARGPIVDEAALVRALHDGIIAGAALDVYEFEPTISRQLRGLANVVLTPHLGSATRHVREAMGMLAVEALRAVLLEHRHPLNAVD